MFSVAFLAIANVAGAQVVTEARVNLRRAPSTAQAPLRVLPTGAPLSLEGADTTVHGFYQVRTQRDEIGWVSADYVAWSDANRSLVGRPETRVLGLSAPLSRIDPDWERSPRRGTTLRNDPDGRTCPARGEAGGDVATFVLKNRADVPLVSHAVGWAALRDLPYADGLLEDGSGIAKDRPRWNRRELVAITRVEGIALTVTGFLAAVKPQGGSSGGEGTNCHWSGEMNTDWHIALTEGPRDPESAAMVVEPTPRIKRLHPEWTKRALVDLTGTARSASDSVRITGFLFYDPDHRNHVGRYRATMWELHPVTRIEIFRSGRWHDL